jgi:hypothetical protein
MAITILAEQQQEAKFHRKPMPLAGQQLAARPPKGGRGRILVVLAAEHLIVISRRR